MLYGKESYLPLILLNLGRIEMNANWNFTQVCSPFLRIYYVEEGEAQVQLPDGTVYTLIPNHLYMIPPFTQHTDRCDGRFVHYYIHVLDQSISGQNIYEQNSFPFKVKANEEILRLIHRLMVLNPKFDLQQSLPSSYDNRRSTNEAVTRFVQQPHAAQYETQAILMMLIARFYRDATPQHNTTDNRLTKVQRYIRQNLSRPLLLDELAEQASLCKDSLIRLFKRELGVTPVEYILNKRVEQAQILLLTQDISIKEVGLKLGFYHQSYFSSQFKAVTGMTPMQYRRQHRST